MKVYVFIVVQYLVLLLPALSGTALTLEQAESYAKKHAPEVRQLQNESRSYQQQSVAEAALDDPKLSVGVANLPDDDLSFTQNEMTQLQVGLSQAFPKGNSLAIKSQKATIKSQVYATKLKLTRLKILKSIRSQWVSLYYWNKALRIYQHKKDFFTQLSETTQSRLANGRVQQKDAVKTRLELSQSRQSILRARQKINSVKGRLKRWLDINRQTPLKLTMPEWIPAKKGVISQALPRHPLMKVARLQAKSSFKDIELSEQQYYPGIEVGVVYGFRQGNSHITRRPRSNFIGARISMDLPLFTSNFQDRQVQASIEHFSSMKAREQANYQELKSKFSAAYANFNQLSRQHTLYEDNLVPEARMYANSTEIAYKNQQTDFTTLVEAYLQRYDTQLAALQTRAKLLQSKVDLLYFQGK